jgi:resuscitation-promoting factor RpfA
VADGAATGRSGAAVVLTAVLGCCAVALGHAAFLEAEGLWAHRSDLQFDDLVLTAALGGLALTGGWLAVGIVLTLGTRALRCSHTLAGRLARAITPSLVRSLLGGACGAAVLVAPTTAPGALAPAPGTSHTHSQDCPRRSCSDVLGGLPMPDRPWGTRAAPRPTRREPELVRVRRGDSLWAIAADHLTAQHRAPQHPADRASPPSQAEIAAAWPRWFDLNRARIGDDPDLIHPGTRLVAPRRLR